MLLRSLREGIDYSTPTGKMLAGTFAALTGCERELMHERARAARAAARARGQRTGRPPRSSADQCAPGPRRCAREARRCPRRWPATPPRARPSTAPCARSTPSDRRRGHLSRLIARPCDPEAHTPCPRRGRWRLDPRSCRASTGRPGAARSPSPARRPRRRAPDRDRPAGRSTGPSQGRRPRPTSQQDRLGGAPDPGRPARGHRRSGRGNCRSATSNHSSRYGGTPATASSRRRAHREERNPDRSPARARRTCSCSSSLSGLATTHARACQRTSTSSTRATSRSSAARASASRSSASNRDRSPGARASSRARMPWPRALHHHRRRRGHGGIMPRRTDDGGPSTPGPRLTAASRPPDGHPGATATHALPVRQQRGPVVLDRTGFAAYPAA